MVGSKQEGEKIGEVDSLCNEKYRGDDSGNYHDSGGGILFR